MEISEQELRELVRDAIARHTEQPTVSRVGGPLLLEAHSSHARFALAPTGDGQCVIERAVRCTHCGYCQSYGH